MKKSLLFLVCCLGLVVGKAQYVAIPDTNFGKWLNTHGYSSCMQGNSLSGWQLDTSCPSVVNATKVNCNAAPPGTVPTISDLTGIQYFDNLDTLYCSYNHINFLPPLPVGLTVLGCWDNHLTSFPSLPESMRWLDCSMNMFSILPALPGNLTYFSCTYNQLNALPALPGSLNTLWTYNNPLTSLPALPDSLTELDCHNNQLSTLPVLPLCLTTLLCHNNQLTSLPPLPSNLTRLSCNDNQLSSIPELPDSLYGFWCYDNPNLYCLAELKKIKFFQFNNTGITCLPNYPLRNLSSNPALTSIPLCNSSNNVNGCLVLDVPESGSFNPKFTISPNPATNQLNISTGGIAISQINIYNTSGSLVSQTKQPLSNVIDISALPAGMYVAVIKTKEGSAMRKWVKM